MTWWQGLIVAVIAGYLLYAIGSTVYHTIKDKKNKK